MKRWVSCIVSLLLIASVFAPISSLFVSASATVVPQGYTAIYTAKDLSNIKLNLKGKYILMNDIDLSSWGKWTPIGIDSYFSGVFDGNGFYIHNMQIDDGTIYRDAGLFSSLNGATVKNVKIKGSINCNSTPVLNAGAVAGSVYDSTISRCASYVTISYKNGTPTGDSCTSAHGAQLCAGGIAGSVWGNTKIEECFNANKITGISSVAPLSIGGIVGEINDYSKIKNCYNIADVSANTDHVSVQVGGITGGQFWADACEISYCYNTGKVSGVCGEWKYDRKYVGGISGELSNNTDSNTVKKCYYESSAPAAVGMVRIAINEGYSVDITVEAKACSYSNMQKKSTYSGFDFANIWEMNSEKSPYPTLKNLIDNEKESDDEQDVPGSNDKEQPDESNSTVDKEILCLKSSFPANGEQLSSLNSITLTFNQNISVSPDWSVGSICIKSYETDEVVFEIDDREFYSRNSVVSGNKTTIPLDGGGLVPGKYYIEVPSGLFVAQGLNSAGKIIKFNGVLGKDDLCFIVESDTCRLTELNSVDYLAFSDVAYNKELYVDMTIKEIFSSVWDSNWKDTNIKYREIFGHIANWRVRNMTSKHNGFAAVAFVNDYNEVVIAFRGSEDPMYMISTLKKYAYADFGSLNSDEKDAVNDWLKNDIPMQIFNKVGDQFFDAIEFYDNIAKKDWIVGVHVTGHSLGGAWADVVSSYSGCYGESFNAVSALDVVYKSYPEYMASKYFGVDKQSFVDHVNEYDVLAGQFGADLKTRRVHSTNFSSVSIAKNHSLESMVTRDLNGNVVLTEYHEIIPDQLSWICVNYYEIIKGFVLNGFSIDAVNGACVDFGTSGNDSFYNILGASNAADFAAEALSSIFSRVSYGGDGNDEIVTGIWFDIIVGGRGNDILSGSLSGDLYLYYNGDGKDYIVDPSGNDWLVLCGFNEQDVIGVRTSQDSQYIEVYCGDDTICYISKEVRSKWSVGTFKIRIVRDEDVIEQEIDKNFFKSQNYTQRVVVSCPVDVEIIDSDGNVACIVTDKVQSIYYGDFGVATCYEIGVGEYEKTIDLSEDYSVRIIGKNDGVMDVSVYSFEDEKLMTPYSANDIDVTNQMVATIKSENNGYSLLVDLNSDGDVDEVVELILSPQDGVNGSDSDGDVISSGNLQNNDESVKWIWIALLGSILLLVCAVITFVTIKARRQRND